MKNSNGSIRDANDSLNRLTDGLMGFFFPRHCPFCRRATGKALLCEECARTLPRCTEVRTGTFGECAAPLYYEDSVRDAILSFKFHGRMEVIDCFGALMAETAADAYADRFDAVTWVPVSKKRLKKRGFDQARLLCASLCVDWHTEPMETLRKIRDNPPQSGLEDAAERRANVLGAYEAVEPKEIRGKRLLLIDDILTTGATLTECVRILKSAGAADVVCLTLAMGRE